MSGSSSTSRMRALTAAGPAAERVTRRRPAPTVSRSVRCRRAPSPPRARLPDRGRSPGPPGRCGRSGRRADPGRRGSRCRRRGPPPAAPPPSRAGGELDAPGPRARSAFSARSQQHLLEQLGVRERLTRGRRDDDERPPTRQPARSSGGDPAPAAPQRHGLERTASGPGSGRGPGASRARRSRVSREVCRPISSRNTSRSEDVVLRTRSRSASSVALDRGERGAELVGRVRDELALGPLAPLPRRDVPEKQDRVHVDPAAAGTAAIAHVRPSSMTRACTTRPPASVLSLDTNGLSGKSGQGSKQLPSAAEAPKKSRAGPFA